jgi:hypothetical protein
MNPRNYFSLIVRFFVAVLAMMVAVQSVEAANPAFNKQSSLPTLLQQMEGSWTVSQKMWPGKNQPAVQLPAATARRRVMQQSFLEEVMESTAGATEAFTRASYFSFNSTTRRFEYFSVDSRMPQMMNERSAVIEAQASPDAPVKLDGGHFVAPAWGNAHRVPFHYRLIIGEIKSDRQVVQLLLTPESGKDRDEFTAFEYQYTRSH